MEAVRMDNIEPRSGLPEATCQRRCYFEMGAPGAIAESSDFDVTLDRRCASGRVVAANLGEHADVTAQLAQSSCELTAVGLDSSDARRVAGGNQSDCAFTLVHLAHL